MFQLYGSAVYDGLQSYCNKDYASTVRCLYPIRHELGEGLGGSHAQTDLFAQVLIVAALKCNDSKEEHFSIKEMAKQLIIERVGKDADLARKRSAEDDLHSFNERVTAMLQTIVI